ncbi:hypothetical protein HHK36_007049 [Tetracentron sinense]|uniref:porphobilinogen synthase n=1 Tax=Tetracentron sinense TaxID=13715 RepID=A0A835DLG3_TETSI|nr:hypothetical protein HHK36_007049 [Tetracentron sinense]
MNYKTVHPFCKQAVAQALAGADVVSPSNMMDGRVGAIREVLDAEDGLVNKSCQMNPENYREALVEACADEAEGADILLISGEYSMIKVVGFSK